MSDPLAYFLTFRTYGTWLHGDPRGSIDRDHNAYGEDVLRRDDSLRRRRMDGMTDPPMLLDSREKRASVRAAIERTCGLREWTIWAVTVRTNHVHCVVSSSKSIEGTLSDLKAWATRALREAGLVSDSAPVWAYHGSTRYLFTEEDVKGAMHYTMFEQGPDLDAIMQEA